MTYVEQFENMFEYFSGGVSGYIYNVHGLEGMNNPTKMPGLYVSDKNIQYFERDIIQDTYKYYLEEEKEEILDETIANILRMNLLSEDSNILAKTIQSKIPEAWEKALQISLTIA